MLRQETYNPTVVVGNFLTKRETKGNGFLAFYNLEDLILVLMLYPNASVYNIDLKKLLRVIKHDLDLDNSLSSVSNSILDQVDQNLLDP